MNKILYLVFASLLLTACSHLPVYRAPIQQGNVITQDMLKKVHTGMTQQQVEEVIGAPVLRNIFDQNRVQYTYTYQPYSLSQKGSKISIRQVTLLFSKGRLSKIEQSGKAPNDTA